MSRFLSALVLIAGTTGAGHAQEAGHPALPTGQALFVGADQCIACHSNISAPSGEDISIGYAWRASMMANAARDPYWHAGVRREAMDHPQARAAIEDKCSTCHMPMARYHAASSGGQGVVFANVGEPLAMDGVSCTVCHQIRDDNFGEPASFDGGFVIDTALPAGERHIFGPHEVDSGRRALMQSAGEFLPMRGDHLQASEMCATCHTLYTHALTETGADAGMLAEQVPYPEWRHSEYRTTQSCQSCHMPELVQDAPITSVLGIPRPKFSQHIFRGGNAFMLRILSSYRAELGVSALPQELDGTIQRTLEFLGTDTARVMIDSARASAESLEFAVSVQSLAGHKLPTAYPSRRVWLHVTVRDAGGSIVFESGAARPDGSIIGNDNDVDGMRFEPHYDRIEGPEQVQIYEPVMVDGAGRVTTGLLYGVRYVKDNRILPRGFDKSTAPWDVAVRGAALDDETFAAGGDRIHYVVTTGDARRPFAVTAELNYQTIGFRWAENLKAYDAFETRRFVSYYEATAAHSAVRLASATLHMP